ncbi:MAG: cupin domain-containing protein [Ectothiorhodospiraceae bacterium]|nr:cupin domain-containing protein [Ectothiorhodospiraceae bacterium]
MSTGRPSALAALLGQARVAFEAADVRAPARDAGRWLFDTLATPGAPAPPAPGTAVPVCAHLDPALATARGLGGPIAHAAEAIAALAPALCWRLRAGTPADDPFARAHGNAELVGRAGLERRLDVTVGLSLVAPGTTYPDHHHPPEEIYVVLSAGEWRQTDGPWHAPGPGGVVHNPPGIVHAMRALDTPLLALWLLRM